MIKWIIEFDVLPELHERLKVSAEQAGHTVRKWDDEWQFGWPAFRDDFVMFHGSLGISGDIKNNAPWKPGVFCSIDKFYSSSWYSSVEDYLIHRKWLLTTVQEFVDDPIKYFSSFGSPNKLFVRPDSPLKPFAGRVIEKDNVTLKALDHGFYYDETDLPIIIAPIRSVGEEWRFVVKENTVITGSGYIAESRSKADEIKSGPQWDFAQEIASKIKPIDPIYILDVCMVDGELGLMELNPFSGADLYSCNTDIVVAAVEEIAKKS